MADTRSVDARADAQRDRDRDREKSAFDFNERRAEDESIGTLLGRLADQGAHLAEKQAELVRAELRTSVADMKEAAGAMAGAAVLGIAGLGVTLMGIGYLIGTALGMWLGTLIVGVVALICAYALFLGGRRKLNSRSMTAERTRHTLERAPDAMAGDSIKADRR